MTNAPEQGEPLLDQSGNLVKSRWPWWANALATVAVLFSLAGAVLAGYAIYTGFERGQDKREAQNQTVIERERIVQEALRQYRQR